LSSDSNFEGTLAKWMLEMEKEIANNLFLRRRHVELQVMTTVQSVSMTVMKRPVDSAT
jgi:hypothetical protein